MLERVVEDWLTNVSERNFEVPFAQLLAVEGYSILHIAKPHGPMEQGKDMLAIDTEGTVWAYQLKSGDLSLQDWRNPEQPLKGQVEDLLDLAVQHPSIPSDAPRRYCLVTTGVLDETLRQTIDAFNQDRRRGGRPALDTMVRGQLQSKIMGTLDSFLPSSMSDLEPFLKLFLADGRDLPDKTAVASFLESRVEATGVSERQLRQLCAELVLLGAHLVKPYQRYNNHVSEIEVWVLVSACLMRLAARSENAHRFVRRTLSLIEVSIRSAMVGLIDELKSRDIYVEGDPFGDAYTYRARITHVMGFVSAALLWEKYLDGTSENATTVRAFIDRNRQQLWLWGEGAVPSFLATGWALGHLRGRPEMLGIAMSLVAAICRANASPPGSRKAKTEDGQRFNGVPAQTGIADPYVDIMQILRAGLGREDSRFGMTYAGQSYSLESLVLILARRLWRQHLGTMWREISYAALSTYIPDSPGTLWRWHNDDGVVEHRYTKNPTRWADLQQRVEELDTRLLPTFADRYPHFLLLFVLVAPHRLNPTTALFLDKTHWNVAGWLSFEE